MLMAKLALLSLAAFIWTFLLHNSSAQPYPGTTIPLTEPEVQKIWDVFDIFDIESWACGLSKQGVPGLWKERCMIETVGRWALVPQTVLAFVVLIVVAAGLSAAIKERSPWDVEREKMLRPQYR